MCTGLKACEAVYRLQNIHRGIPLEIHHEELWSPYLLAVKALACMLAPLMEHLAYHMKNTGFMHVVDYL